MNGEDSTEQDQAHRAARATTAMTASYLRSHPVDREDVVTVVSAIGEVINHLLVNSVQSPPPVPVEKSVQYDYLVCLEDGRRLRSMRYYLKLHYNMTPDQYRRKWDLPDNYPMTAPAFHDSCARAAQANGIVRGSAHSRRLSQFPSLQEKSVPDAQTTDEADPAGGGGSTEGSRV